MKPNKIITRLPHIGPIGPNQKARAVMVSWKELKKRIKNNMPEENEAWLEAKYKEMEKYFE